MNRYQFVLTAILIYFLVLAGLFIRAVPMFEASDEAEHFIYVHQVLETGALPVIQSREDMANQTDAILRWNNQSHHAPLYYLLSAGVISWSERADIADYLTPNELIFLRNTTENNANKWLHPYSDPTSDTHIAVTILRIANALIGIGTLLLIFRAGMLIFDNKWWALVGTLFAASIPTFVVVHSSVSNDPLTILLYSTGILWALRVLKIKTITLRDTAIISLILAGIALTKLTGVSLFGVVFAALMWGAYRKYWGWLDALRTMVVSGITALILAGWWYWRNFTLYGDPLALDATNSIWGRETALTWAIFVEDVQRIAKSLWMMVGYLHEPVFAPDWFYILIAALVAIGIISLIRSTIRMKNRDSVLIMILAFVLVAGLLLSGTRTVDISYGRLLLPAVIPLVMLLMIGWRGLVGRLSVLFVLPFVMMAFYAPLVLVPRAYPTMVVADSIPDEAIAIDWATDGLVMAALDIHAGEALIPNDVLLADLYFRGGHIDNPALLVTVIDTLRVARLAHLEIFPGMAATSQLNPETLYRLPLRLPIKTPEDVREPRLANIIIKWVNLEDNSSINFDNDETQFEIATATFHDTRYEADTLATPINAHFGDVVQLSSMTAPAEASAGEHIQFAFEWLPLRDVEADWTLTVQLLDENGDLAAQVDDVPYWYPTSYWLADVAFNDTRILALPEDLPSGDYSLHLGWYRETETGFERLPISQGVGRDNLAVMPITVKIE